jgi:hypothetical protein
MQQPANEPPVVFPGREPDPACPLPEYPFDLVRFGSPVPAGRRLMKAPIG